MKQPPPIVPQRPCSAEMKVNGLDLRCSLPADHLPASEHQAIVRWTAPEKRS